MKLYSKASIIKIVEMLVASTFLLDFTEGFPNSNQMRTKRQVTIDQVGTKVGCLKTRSHKVSGEVYFINNSSQLYIKDFTFDGLGFGVYFYVALQGAKRPFSRKNSVAVNWPDPLSAERTPIKKAFNKEDIVINLPSDISGDKVVWLSLWCEEFGISFGDLVFKSKKPRENSCAPGAKKAQLAALANRQLQLPELTDQQLAVLANNPLLLQQLRQQGLLLELQLLQG